MANDLAQRMRLAAALGGKGGSGDVTPITGTLRRTTGTATADSASGKVTVQLSGGDPIEVPCTTAVKAGDTVSLLVSGGVATAVGVAGWGDSMKKQADATKAEVDGHEKLIADVKQDVADYKATASATYATKTEVDDKTGAITQTIEADYLKSSDASETYAEKSELASAVDGVSSTLSASYTKTADLASTAAVKDAKKAGTDASAALDAYKSDVSETYATKTALTQTSDTLSASISDTLSDAKSYTDSSITTEVTNRDAAIKAQADSISLEVSKTYAKQETFDSYKNSNDEAVSGIKATADSAASDLAEYKTSVSETYATKASLTATDRSIRSDVSSTYLSKSDAASTYATSTSLTQTASDLTATISKAQTTANGAAETANATATMIRQYAGGVLVAKTGATVGALVNANGSFDVVTLTWANGVPSVSGTLSSFDADSADIGTAATPGAAVNLLGGAARFYVKQWDAANPESREVRLNSSGATIIFGVDDEATNGGLWIDPYRSDGNGGKAGCEWPFDAVDLRADKLSIKDRAVSWQSASVELNTSSDVLGAHSSSCLINPGLGLAYLSVDMSFESPGWRPGTGTWVFRLPEELRPKDTTRLYNIIQIYIGGRWGAHLDVHSDGYCYPTWGWQAENIMCATVFPLALLGL